MKVRSVTYAATINLGSYNNERIEITVDLAETDTVAQAISFARQHVEETTFAPQWLATQRKLKRVA